MGLPCQVAPPPGQDGWYPAGGYPAGGVPFRGGGTWGTPTVTRQHMEYMISGGRYASCVHAGGLSCIKISNIGDKRLMLNL